jgi:TRAP-type mannitol/chloroaromatic compound transport system permease large subunit
MADDQLIRVVDFIHSVVIWDVVRGCTTKTSATALGSAGERAMTLYKRTIREKGGGEQRLAIKNIW